MNGQQKNNQQKNNPKVIKNGKNPQKKEVRQKRVY